MFNFLFSDDRRSYDSTERLLDTLMHGHLGLPGAALSRDEERLGLELRAHALVGLVRERVDVRLVAVLEHALQRVVAYVCSNFCF